MDFKRYRINKVINNNVICIVQNNKDVIVMANGIGFKNKVGNYISLKPDYDVYRLQNKALIHRFEMLLEEIPYDCIELTQNIIMLAKNELKKDFNYGLLMSLADHINFAVSNYQKGYNVGLESEEIKRFYREEYGVGVKALSMINEHYKIKLELVEASSIAFHFITAEYSIDSHRTKKMIEAIHDIINIINKGLNINLDKDSLNYSRLIIHLKFFIQRVLNKENEGSELLNVINSVDHDKRIDSVIDNISEYFENKFSYSIAKEERFYLYLHIYRNLKKENKHGL